MPFTDWSDGDRAQHGQERDARRQSGLSGVIRECALWTVGLTVLLGAFALSWRFVPL